MVVLVIVEVEVKAVLEDDEDAVEVPGGVAMVAALAMTAAS